MRAQLEGFLGKEVIFPDSLLSFNCPEEIKVKEIVDMKCKLVVVIDKIQCIDCQFKKVYSWVPFWEAIKEKGIPTILIIETTEIYGFEEVFKRYNVKFPFFVDLKGSFKKSNRLPGNESLKTFLVFDNKVIIAGEPYNNSKLWKLYENQIDKLVNDETK